MNRPGQAKDLRTRLNGAAGKPKPGKGAVFEAIEAEAAASDTAAEFDADDLRIVARPNGYYWLNDGGRIEVGPFASADEAWANMHAADEDAPEPGETLEEAEAEIGLAHWNDPDTGEPAEGSGPRFEDH